MVQEEVDQRDNDQINKEKPEYFIPEFSVGTAPA